MRKKRIDSPIGKFVRTIYSISFFFLLLVGCSDSKDDEAGSTSGLSAQIPSIGYVVVATGFDQPLQITHAGDGNNRLFVVEKSGKIRMIQNNVVLPEVFLNLSEQVSSGSEQGLLGIAFPPDFHDKKIFYVNYTDKTGVGNTVIARYSLSQANINLADPDSGVKVLSIAQPFANHNGGQLAFGPDGLLYIGTGDGGGTGDPSNNAQNTNSLLGKILRVDVNSAAPYTIPSGNPFNNEIYAWGLRNPWRFSFDRSAGDLYIADVGQDELEEINHMSVNQTGANFGWKIMEGSKCFRTETCNQENLILPITEYNHSAGDCSVTGGYVYRGSEFPALQGVYLYSDFCSGKIRGLKNINGQFVQQDIIDTPFKISSFGEDEAGNIYFADFDSGAIYKIVVK